MPDTTPHTQGGASETVRFPFTIENKGRALAFRAEFAQVVGDRHVVTNVEMGVRLGQTPAEQAAAHTNLTRQVRDLHLHVALGGTVPVHLTAERHSRRGRAVPRVDAETLSQLQRET